MAARTKFENSNLPFESMSFILILLRWLYEFYAGATEL